ncbi:MAG TPA: L,D-transpeptidase [Terracidiphilus sp.]|nr:L,D-transpeptidase [Terracidiphilus sp.]
MKALKTASKLGRLANFAAAAIAAAAAIVAAQAVAQNPAPAKQAPAPARLLVVSLQDRKLALVEDGRAVRIYPIAIGKPSTPSPVGTFTIESHVVNPTYYHGGRVIPPGPSNPVGNRWMGLSVHGYGIHGTNAPHSIGKAASHGCIRMARADLDQLFPLVSAGDKVEIVGQRNAETEAFFGNAPAPAPRPMLTAKANPPAAPQIPAAAPTTPAAQLPARVLNVSAQPSPAPAAQPVAGSM